jgi:hypothetical protein
VLGVFVVNLSRVLLDQQGQFAGVVSEAESFSNIYTDTIPAAIQNERGELHA